MGCGGDNWVKRGWQADYRLWLTEETLLANGYMAWYLAFGFCRLHFGRVMKNKIAETRKFPEKFVYSLFLILSADGGSG